MVEYEFASEFVPLDNFKMGQLAFTSGSSFSCGMLLTNLGVSELYKLFFQATYCNPSCQIFSYIISVGVGSLTSHSMSACVRSYFVEKYKKQWLFKNQGKYFFEDDILKRVPFANSTPLSLEEGLGSGSSSSPLSLEEGLDEKLGFVYCGQIQPNINNKIGKLIVLHVSYRAIFFIFNRVKSLFLKRRNKSNKMFT